MCSRLHHTEVTKSVFAAAAVFRNFCLLSSPFYSTFLYLYTCTSIYKLIVFRSVCLFTLEGCCCCCCCCCCYGFKRFNSISSTTVPKSVFAAAAVFRNFCLLSSPFYSTFLYLYTCTSIYKLIVFRSVCLFTLEGCCCCCCCCCCYGFKRFNSISSTTVPKHQFGVCGDAVGERAEMFIQ